MFRRGVRAEQTTRLSRIIGEGDVKDEGFLRRGVLGGGQLRRDDEQEWGRKEDFTGISF